MSAERTVTVTEVVPRTLDSVTTDSLDADRWLSRRYSADDTGFTRLNMVTSVTGSIAGSDGTSETITSPTDRMILRAVRANADVVVVGATTARTERYLLPAHARLAVVTATGDLDGVRLTRPGRPPALVLSSRAHRERVHARLAGGARHDRCRRAARSACDRRGAPGARPSPRRLRGRADDCDTVPRGGMSGRDLPHDRARARTLGRGLRLTVATAGRDGGGDARRRLRIQLFAVAPERSCRRIQSLIACDHRS